MEIRIRSTGVVMLEDQFRRWLRDTNGPSYDTLTQEVMDALDVDPVLEGPQATGGTVYQYSMRQGVEQKADGKWYSKYVLGPIFDSPEAQAEYEAQKDVEQANAVRKQRNELLAASDWTQLPDSPVPSATWTAYRQALRDITAQAGFPWNVTWPAKP